MLLRMLAGRMGYRCGSHTELDPVWLLINRGSWTGEAVPSAFGPSSEMAVPPA